jgi:hypothetical protein
VNEKSIVVPPEMRKAFFAAETHHGLKYDPVVLLRMLEAAIRWLSENPIEATYTDWQQFCSEKPGMGVEPFAGWWQRRMFFNREPEVPEEIKDLILPDVESGFFKPEILNARLLEAYRRGRESK